MWPSSWCSGRPSSPFCGTSAILISSCSNRWRARDQTATSAARRRRRRRPPAAQHPTAPNPHPLQNKKVTLETYYAWLAGGVLAVESEEAYAHLRSNIATWATSDGNSAAVVLHCPRKSLVDQAPSPPFVAFGAESNSARLRMLVAPRSNPAHHIAAAPLPQAMTLGPTVHWPSRWRPTWEFSSGSWLLTGVHGSTVWTCRPSLASTCHLLARQTCLPSPQCFTAAAAT